MGKLINIDEVAQLLNVQPEIVRHLANEGVIPAYRIAGSFLRFDPEEIQRKKDSIAKNVQNVQHNFQSSQLKKYPNNAIVNSVFDFFYFYDFYIICTFLLIVLMYIIIKY